MIVPDHKVFALRSAKNVTLFDDVTKTFLLKISKIRSSQDFAGNHPVGNDMFKANNRNTGNRLSHRFWERGEGVSSKFDGRGLKSIHGEAWDT